MALINCPECGKEMSDSVKKCPHCGYKIKSSKGMNKVLLAVIIVGVCLAALVTVLIIVISNSVKKASKLKEQKPAVMEEVKVPEKIEVTPEDNFNSIEASVSLSPNLGKTFTASTTNQNIDGVYNIYLKQELPIVIRYKDYCEVTINKINYYTKLENEEMVRKYGKDPDYCLYYSIEYDYTCLDEDWGTTGLHTNLVYYDQDGNIIFSHGEGFDGDHGGKLIGDEYDFNLPMGTYELEILLD